MRLSSERKARTTAGVAGCIHKEVREGFQLSKAEAASSFGDDRMLIERFIENPHHIEIQVVADTHGNVAAFPERECSVQRRNQKVIEESPSCMVLPETRKKMQEQAILLCKATGYRSAGTVEMLCDENQNFYFLEMNTRLQVEHPVTELVSGEDLVEHMLYVAAGHPLPDRLINGPTGPHVPFHGNAFEVRVYAEDPIRGFLPSIGPLISYKEPRTFTPAESGDGSTVRIDTGVFEGGTISMHYDPLISKLCSHAPTREHSIQTIERALDEYVIQGLGNNLTFCRDVFRNPVFRKGIYSTKFIPEQYPDGFNGVRLSTAETNQLVGIAAAIHSARTEHLPRTRNPVAVEEDGDEFDESMVDYTEDMVIVLPPTKGCGHNEIKQFAVTLSVGSELCADITPMDAQGELDLSKKSKIVLADLDWHSERPSALVTFDHAASVNPDTTAHAKESDESDHSTAAVQYLGRAKTPAGQGGFLIRYNGSDQEVVVHTPREHALSRHMLPPALQVPHLPHAWNAHLA